MLFVLLTPSTEFHTNLGKQCVEAGCSITVFLFPNVNVNVATIYEVPHLTAGNLYTCSCLQTDEQDNQFIADLRRFVSQPRAFNAVMRIRKSTGTHPFEFLGNVQLQFVVRSSMAIAWLKTIMYSFRLQFSTL